MTEHVTELSTDEIDAVSGGQFFLLNIDVDDSFNRQSNRAYQNAQNFNATSQDADGFIAVNSNRTYQDATNVLVQSNEVD